MKEAWIAWGGALGPWLCWVAGMVGLLFGTLLGWGLLWLFARIYSSKERS